MIEQAFEVAAEFRFDVGQAIVNTKALQNAVDDVSKSAGTALGSLNYLASGLVAHLGFGSGGLLSVMSAAVKVSEEFNFQSLMFANNISQNFGVLQGTIGTFNDRLRTSDMLMGNLTDQSIKFGVDSGSLASITQKLATPLAMHGKLGTNYENAMSMGRNVMLASEATGINPHMASESMVRALTDRMPVVGQLFSRLVNTPAFKAAHISKQGQLSSMDTGKKIDLLTKALEQLGGNADFIAHRLNKLGVQFTMLKNNMINVLKPIGDALVVPLRIMMQKANAYLQAHGKMFGEAIGNFIGSLIKDPEKLFINLMQLKTLGKDFKTSFHVAEIVQGLLFLRWGLGLLGITLNGGLIFRGLAMLRTFIYEILAVIWRLGIVGHLFTFLRIALVAVGEILLPVLFFLQILSRARAIAIVNDAKAWLEIGPKLSAVWVRMKDAVTAIFLPISMAIDWWAKFLAPIFEWSIIIKLILPLLEGVAWLLEWIGKGVIYLTAALSGLVSVIIGFMFDIVNMKNPFSNVMTNLKDGYQDFLTRNPLPGQGGTPVTKSIVTNNNHIEARFDMREQMEPDRIAFAVTQHLKKLALNPTQGRGYSLDGGFATQ